MSIHNDVSDRLSVSSDSGEMIFCGKRISDMENDNVGVTELKRKF